MNSAVPRAVDMPSAACGIRNVEWIRDRKRLDARHS